MYDISRVHIEKTMPLVKQYPGNSFCLRIVVIVLLIFSAPLAADINTLQQRDKAAVKVRLASDIKGIQYYRRGLQRIMTYAHKRKDLFAHSRKKTPSMLRRSQKEAIWSTWKSLLDYFIALENVREFHNSFFRIKNRIYKGQSFLVNYSSFVTQYRYALEFLMLTENDPAFELLLNEPVPELGLPAGSYARFKYRFLHATHASKFAALSAYHQVVDKSLAPALRASIEQDTRFIWRTGTGKGQKMTVRNAINMFKRSAFKAWLPVQAGVSEWMGDTKVYRVNSSLITEKQIRHMMKILRPGDVLLERRDWYVSNIGLPGFWPHTAIYVGTAKQRRYYFGRDQRVRAWVRSMGQEDGDFEALLRRRYPAAYVYSETAQEHGYPPRVMEAVSEGVTFTTLEHSAAADSVAVLRPRLSRKDKAIAIFRAFHYYGRPYDFNFDFVTDSELVCSELIYKAYEPRRRYRGLSLPIVDILGRKATLPNDIVRQFDKNFGSKKQQFNLVIFLDGYERGRKAIKASLSEFRKSWQRPKWHIIVKRLPRQHR
ncbi:MAG: hypothetical protein BMS9Abin11_1242 [Gammaproteobacteria bacterium]|nr:MAG: hypothetical protein BMS9Abin11_1242 [Gammaproteobacteria bacterium]